MRLIFRLWLLIAVLCGAAFSGVACADEGKSAHLTARLIAQSLTVAPGGDVYAAIDYTPTKGWHTYWLNPGDTGLAPKITWDLPDGVTAGDIQFQPPVLLPTQNLMSYGYEGRNVLLVKLHNGSKFAPGDALPLHARVDFLVCADVCVPESLTVSNTLKVGAAVDGPDAAAVRKAIDGLPQTADLAGADAATVDIAGDQVEFGFPLAHVEPKGAYFFPAQGNVVSYPAAQTVDMGEGGFTLRTKAAGATLPEGPLSGVLKLADGSAYTIVLTRAPLPASVHGLGASGHRQGGGSMALLLTAVIGAFIGGMILNLMPCVFPILSMKLMALTRAGHDQSLARREALLYGAGAMASFIILAIMLGAARALGQSLGWGFQLQSPYVTAGLAIIIVLVALNMGGFFHAGAWLQKLGGNVRIDWDRPQLAAFMTGVLAVVVAAPCTAPFMGPAVGFALTQGGVVSFAVFLALGLGFALPFVALTFLITQVPAVARLLPKPGDWMISLQRFLSVVMFMAAAWLIWVFSQQVSQVGLLLLIIGVIMITAAVVDRLKLAKYAAPVLVVLGLVLVMVAARQPPETHVAAHKRGLPVVAYDADRLAALRAEGKPVLIDMTAAWCVSCKVNEMGALSDARTLKAFKDTGTVYMVGDWTNQDARISRYLSLYGRSGVPLYVYYGARNAQPKVLPQILNADDVVAVVTAGAK